MDIPEKQSTEYKTFPVQESTRIGLFLAALFLAIGGLYIVYLTHTYWDRAPLVLQTIGTLSAIGAFSFAAWCLYSWQQAPRWGVAVGKAGLISLNPKKDYPRLAWSEMTDIYAHFSHFWGGIVLKGSEDKPTITIRSDLVGWQELFGLVLEHAPILQQPVQLPVTFQSKELRSIGLGFCYIFLLTLFISWEMSEGKQTVWSIWFIVYFTGSFLMFLLPRLIVYLFGPRRLVVEETGFSFQKGFKHTQVPFSSVKAVQLMPGKEYKDRQEVTVKATLEDGQKLSLGVFGGDPFAVYRDVRTGWEQGR